MVLDAQPSKYYANENLRTKTRHTSRAVYLQAAAIIYLTNQQLMKPRDEIETIIEEKGITEDKKIICYCGICREATNLF